MNKSAYTYGENIIVTIDIKNDSRKVVRKIRVRIRSSELSLWKKTYSELSDSDKPSFLQIFAVQHVDVCMFSNGKFKNIVAEADIQKQVSSNENYHCSYPLLPVRGATKNWIAVEGALFNSSSSHDTNLVALNSKLASSAPRGAVPPTQDEKNVFAIYVSYYVKVKLSLGGMGGEMSLKLPFVLGNIELDVNSSAPATAMASLTADYVDNNRNNHSNNDSNESSVLNKIALHSQSATPSHVSSQHSGEEITTVREIETKLRLSETYHSDNATVVMDDEIIQVHYESSKSKIEKFKNCQYSRAMHESVDVESEELNQIAPAVLSQSDSIKSFSDLHEGASNGSNSASATAGGVTTKSNVVTAQVHHDYQRESSDETTPKL